MQLFRKDRPLTPSWDLIRPGLSLLKEHGWPIFYLSFLPSLVTTVGIVLVTNHLQGGQASNTIKLAWDGRTIAGVIIAAIGILWTIITYPGVIKLKLQALEGKHPGVYDSFKAGLPRLLPFIAASILLVLVVSAGYILFIIPGIILTRGLFLGQYYVVDQQLSPIAALRKCWEDSKPNAAYIWGTIGVTVIISLAASFVGNVPVVGYLLTLLVNYLYFFAPAMRYAEITRNYSVPTSDTDA